MRHVIAADTHLSLGEGPFRIRRIRPGLGIDPEDTGFGPLGLVDRAHLSAGLVVEMHEHRDDEIVSYLRSGSLTHTDSDGNSETVTPTRLMVMNAGAGFSHEERMPEGEDIHMLQIFLRPRAAGLEPRVQFVELDESARSSGWRTIVVPDRSGGEEGGVETDPSTDSGSGSADDADDADDAERTTVAAVRQDAWIHDASVSADRSIDLPRRAGCRQWLHVFDGLVELPDGRTLGTGDAVAADGDDRIDRVHALEDSDLVLFELDANAGFTLEGSLSRGR